MDRVTVVIVHYRCYEDLTACLTSIEEHGSGLPVIVVDHESDGAAVERVQRRFPRVTFLPTRHNPGFARGVNAGAAHVTTPYMLLLNPDCLLHGPISTLADCLDRMPDAAVVGPRLLDGDGALQPSARRFPDITTAIAGRRSWLTAVAANNWLSRWNLPVTARDTSNREIDWVSGACMMIRRDAFVQVGGLDEGFFLYWEDADFCRRLKTAGWTTRWNPEPAVTHVAARSSRSVPYRALIAFHRSAFRYFVNHAGPAGRLLSPLVVALLAGRLAFAVTYRAARGVLTPRAATRL